MTNNEKSEDEIYIVMTKENNGYEKIVSVQKGKESITLVSTTCPKNIINDLEMLAKDFGKTFYIYKYKREELIQEISGAN